MGNGKLAIVLPTYRFDATARHCIETVASAACEDVDVFIGDNSGDPAKWAFLRALAERSEHCHIYCHETNLGSGGNWIFLMSRQDHEFICLVSDDDIYSPDYFLAGFEELKRNPACAAASGLLLVLTWHGSRMQLELAASNVAQKAADRIATYTGFNTVPYAVHRRAAVSNHHAYMSDRPFFASYMDQFFTYAVLSQGTYVVDTQRRLFVYNNTNWANAETCAASDASYYIAVGLPEQFRHLHLMCWGVDVIHYFNSIYRPPGLSDEEALTIVKILYGRLFEQGFRQHLLANLPAIGALFSHAPDTIGTLQAMIATSCEDPLRLMSLFLVVLRVFDGALADRYEAFFANSYRPIALSSEKPGS